jgi:gliding motility-associated-like protein
LRNLEDLKAIPTTSLKHARTLCVLLFTTFFTSQVAQSQTYFANGDAEALGNDRYRLTEARTFQNGSVWYADMLDLNKPFDLSFFMYLGSADIGADGIVLVLQNRGNQALGQSGGGIGFEGFSPSLGIEFDTYQNLDFGDPVYDHIGVFKDGAISHNAPNSLVNPVPILRNFGNVEDNQNHNVRFAWDPATKNLRLWFDCELRVNLTFDLVQDVFGGSSSVFWGFTSATGGQVNVHQVELRDDIIIKKEFKVCDGDSIRLSAQPSEDNFYRWTPNEFLSDDDLRAPWTKPERDMEYVVEYRGLCNEQLFDTFTIDWGPKPIVPAIADTLLCGPDAVKVVDWNPVIADEIRWNDGSSARRREIAESGDYSVSATIGHCKANTSFNVYKTDFPSVSIEGPDALCDGNEIELRANGSPEDIEILWSTGSMLESITVNAVGTYSVRAENRCGEATAEKTIIEQASPFVDLGEDRDLCEGDSFYLNDAGSTPTKTWNTGSQEDSILIREPGLFYVVVEDEFGCTSADSVLIRLVTSPAWVLDPEILLCRNEVFVVDVPDEYTEVIWNDGFSENQRQFQNDSGLFEVTYGNLCGEDQKSTNIEVIDCYCDVYFPNAFTPNGDVVNSVYAPVRDCTKMLSFSITIYNRWGQVVFRGNRWEDLWDGRFQETVIPGVYAYVSEYKAQLNGYEEDSRVSGIIHVVR